VTLTGGPAPEACQSKGCVCEGSWARETLVVSNRGDLLPEAKKTKWKIGARGLELALP